METSEIEVVKNVLANKIQESKETTKDEIIPIKKEV